MNSQAVLIRARDGERVPLNQRHRGDTDVDMLAGGMRQMLVHPKARHAVLKDSSLCKGRVGLDAPTSQNIEDVERDTSNNEAHGIGRVQSHQYQEDKEQGMTDDECFVGEPPHGPGCSHDDETQGGVGCKAVLDLGQSQLLSQE